MKLIAIIAPFWTLFSLVLLATIGLNGMFLSGYFASLLLIGGLLLGAVTLLVLLGRYLEIAWTTDNPSAATASALLFIALFGYFILVFMLQRSHTPAALLPR